MNTARCSPPWLCRSPCASPSTLSRRTRRRPCTGAFHTDVETVFPRQAISRGRPTLTDNNCAIVRSLIFSVSATRGILPEAPLRHVDVAPRPRGPGHYGSHHGMARLMEVLCRVLAGRGVAAADMAARLALPELDPARAFFQALLTGARRSRQWEVGRGQIAQVFTQLC